MEENQAGSGSVMFKSMGMKGSKSETTAGRVDVACLKSDVLSV